MEDRNGRDGAQDRASAYELLGRIDDLGNVDRADEAKAKILSLINAGASDDEVRAVCGQIVIWIERLESQPAREVVIDATGGE